jgi:hypothetical protein
MAADFRLHFNVTGSLLESARECEAEVFLRWFGNTREQLDQEYQAYEDCSVFIAIADSHDDVVGEVRLLVPGGRNGLKMPADVGNDPWNVDGARAAAAVGMNPASTWEVATIGLRYDRETAGASLSESLFYGMLAYGRANRMMWSVAILDDRVRRLMSSIGLLLRVLPGTGTAPYLGSPASTPVYTHLRGMLETQRKQYPDAHRLVTLGLGLNGVSVPPLDAFVLPPPQHALVS